MNGIPKFLEVARLLGEFNDGLTLCRNVIIYFETESGQVHGIVIHGSICAGWKISQWQKYLETKLGGFDHPKRVLSVVVTFGGDERVFVAEATDLPLYGHFDRIMVEDRSSATTEIFEITGLKFRKISEVWRLLRDLPESRRNTINSALPRVIETAIA